MKNFSKGGIEHEKIPEFNPQSFAVIGAGPVGCIVAAFLAKDGYDVTLCDMIPELINPALDPGIIIEGAENLQQKVTRVCTSVDELGDYNPDVIIITVKANALPLIVSAIERFTGGHVCGQLAKRHRHGTGNRQTLGEKPAMRAVVNYGCGLKAPAMSTCPSTTRRTLSRSWIPNRSTRPSPIAEALTAAVSNRSHRSDHLHGLAQRHHECLHEPGVCGNRTDHGPGHE